MATISDIALDVADLILLNKPVFVWGPPGCGKSQMFAQVAKLLGLRIIDIRLSMFDAVDLRGIPFADLVAKLTVWLRPALFDIKAGDKVLIFFDEMDRAQTSVLNAALQIVLDRRMGEFDLPASVRIAAAGNGKTDRVGTNKIGSAHANRFTHLYVQPDAEAAARHWLETGVDPILPAFIRFRPTLIQNAPIDGEHAFATARQWESCADFLDRPVDRMARLVAGTVGSPAAADFVAFVKTFRTLPSIAAILANPHAIDVPSDRGQCFAVAAALGRAMTQANIGNAVAYLERMPREYMVLGMTDATRRDATLRETSAYIAHATTHQDIY